MKKLISLSFAFLMAISLMTSCSEDDENMPLEVSINNGILLENSEAKIITPNDLKLSDVDTEDIDIVFTVTKGTENGKLVFVDDLEIVIAAFTQQDIADNKVQYVHDGSFTQVDNFEYSVTDGETVLTGTFTISIGEKQVNHVFVLNEGNNTGSISYIDAVGNVTNNYFKNANNIDLGQYPQSMTVNDKHAFVVVTTGTGAGYVLVANRSTLKVEKTITGLSYPREIILLEDKAYISNGNGQDASYMKQSNELYILDFKTMTISGTIPVGAGPEKMVLSNGKVYVANSGGWSNDDNTISVIDPVTDTVTETLTVKSCPKDMVVDANDDVWVYCGGVPDYSNYPNVTYTEAGISKVTTTSGTVKSWDIASPSGAVKSIAISKDKSKVYYLTDGVYVLEITATALPTVKLVGGLFNGIDVHPVSDEIWVCESTGAKTAGKVIIYSKEGSKKTEYDIGNVPNSSTFVY